MPQAVVSTIRWEDLWPGWEVPLTYWAVTSEEMTRFASAIGSEDAIYTDEEAAQEAGFKTIVAHPGFINIWHFEPSLLRAVQNNPIFPTMHNRTKLELFAPIYPGDLITCKMKVHDKVESAKGRRFASWLIELYNQDGELVARKIHSSQWLKEWSGTKPGPRPLY
jgi:acyl dehydratase